MNIIEIAPSLEVVHTGTYDQSQVGGDPTYIGDIHAALSILINRGANMAIAANQGICQLHITTPTALTVIQSAPTGAFSRARKPNTTGLDEYHPNYVGTLNGTPMFIDNTADDSVPHRTVVLGSDGVFRVSEVHLKNISFI